MIYKGLLNVKASINKYRKISIFTLVLAILYYFCLPSTLFDDPYSTVLTSNTGDLLGARIANDGQWRFPLEKTLPEKFKTCIIQYEDEFFYAHPGFNPVSIIKALQQNVRAGDIKRGGSTLTQQVIRLSRKGKVRSYWEKVKELILATRLELRSSKEEILALYAGHAPFGGNVVGLEAASWRYYQRNASELSWAESATLAVLPNAPSLIYPGKNQLKLLRKRNRLLEKLLQKGKIDSLTYRLSIAEELPLKPHPLPQTAPHLLQKMTLKHPGKYIETTIDHELQTMVNTIVSRHYSELKQNEIHNMSVLVLDVNSKKVLSYVGNTPTDRQHQNNVDIVDKPRSTGSILKPFLYASMLDAGELLPNTLVADIPTYFGSYQPENFNQEFDGAVPAGQALARSLNIPAVRMLKQYGLQRFYRSLKELKLRDISKNADHYGLSLILGGAESNLWDLCRSYSGMASTLNHYVSNSSRYYVNEFCDPLLLKNREPDLGPLVHEKTIFDAASIYYTFESMKQVNRPREDESWDLYNSSQDIAWKTGTSFGFRDAWSIGVTKDYVVGVWVGNADGEGRPGLVGIQAAAPVMFDIFELLPTSIWFLKPYDEMTEVSICTKSGHRSSPNCDTTENQYIPISGVKTEACPYHKLIHIDTHTQEQVNTLCESSTNIKHKSWFVLPPLQAHYYKAKNPFYKSLPKIRNDCETEASASMEFIYPKQKTLVFLPKGFSGKTNDLILKVAHSKPKTEVYWYLNNTYIGKTSELHEMAIIPDYGEHTITVVDQWGNELNRDLVITK